MLKQFVNAVSAISTLCMTLQSHPTGARYLIALAAILTVAYIVHCAKS